MLDHNNFVHSRRDIPPEDQQDLTRYMLRQCYIYARKFSEDPKTQNGSAIITPNANCPLDQDADHIFFGTNRFPDYIYRTKHRQTMLDDKDKWIIHAEEDVVHCVVNYGAPVSDTTMYCCWAPCVRCARTIINTGIRTLIVHKQMHDRTYDKYEASIQEAIKMLKLGSVEYIQYDGKLDGCTNLMNNEIWYP